MGNLVGKQCSPPHPPSPAREAAPEANCPCYSQFGVHSRSAMHTPLTSVSARNNSKNLHIKVTIHSTTTARESDKCNMTRKTKSRSHTTCTLLGTTDVMSCCEQFVVSNCTQTSQVHKKLVGDLLAYSTQVARRWPSRCRDPELTTRHNVLRAWF